MSILTRMRRPARNEATPAEAGPSQWTCGEIAALLAARVDDRTEDVSGHDQLQVP